jgi:hypothetical protein
MRKQSTDSKYIDSTERVTRAGDSIILTVPRPLTNKLMKAPVYAGSSAWKNLPNETKELQITGFKREVRKHITGQAPETDSSETT